MRQVLLAVLFSVVVVSTASANLPGRYAQYDVLSRALDNATAAALVSGPADISTRILEVDTVRGRAFVVIATFGPEKLPSSEASHAAIEGSVAVSAIRFTGRMLNSTGCKISNYRISQCWEHPVNKHSTRTVVVFAMPPIVEAPQNAPWAKGGK